MIIYVVQTTHSLYVTNNFSGNIYIPPFQLFIKLKLQLAPPSKLVNLTPYFLKYNLQKASRLLWASMVRDGSMTNMFLLRNISQTFGM